MKTISKLVTKLNSGEIYFTIIEFLIVILIAVILT